jgi:hypothetical protein
MRAWIFPTYTANTGTFPVRKSPEKLHRSWLLNLPVQTRITPSVTYQEEIDVATEPNPLLLTGERGFVLALQTQTPTRSQRMRGVMGQRRVLGRYVNGGDRG